MADAGTCDDQELIEVVRVLFEHISHPGSPRLKEGVAEPEVDNAEMGLASTVHQLPEVSVVCDDHASLFASVGEYCEVRRATPKTLSYENGFVP